MAPATGPVEGRADRALADLLGLVDALTQPTFPSRGEVEGLLGFPLEVRDESLRDYHGGDESRPLVTGAEARRWYGTVPVFLRLEVAPAAAVPAEAFRRRSGLTDRPAEHVGGIPHGASPEALDRWSRSRMDVFSRPNARITAGYVDGYVTSVAIARADAERPPPTR